MSFRSLGSENVRDEDLVVEDSGRGCPLPFINIGNTSSGRPRVAAVTEAAKRLLSNIEGPICVVSSIGLFKSGKSSVLNRVLLPSGEDGFHVDSNDDQPCTRGLWVWSEPIKAQAPDGTEVSMILVDCEGLDGGSSFQERDCCIFSLSVLLSSYIIYNSVGALADDAVETLWRFVHGMANSVQVNSSKDDEEKTEQQSIADFMPKLLWAFRDEKLQRKDEHGRQFSSRQHLERALEEATREFGADKVQNLNKAKAGLKHLFPDRDCFPAVNLTDPEASRQESPNKSGGLDSSVLSLPRRLAALREAIRKQAEVKTLFGAELSGRMLVELAEELVTAVNNASPFNIADAWIEVCDRECAGHMEEGVRTFAESLSSLRPQLPVGSSDLASAHQDASAAAMSAFALSARDLQAGRVRKYKGQLEATLKAAWEKVSADNWKAGAYRGRELLRELYRPVEEKLHGNEYASFSDYERDRLKARSAFLEQAPRHQSVLSVLHEAMEDAVASAATRFITKATVQAQDVQYRLEEEVENLRFDLKQERAASEGAISALRDKTAQQEAWISAIKTKEREARETAANDKERHAQQLLDVGQAHSKALAEALQERDEALRARDEANNTLHIQDRKSVV